ncbi:bifunctional DNA primase/polymerase [Actinacidiphila oryziradicis]|uniref:DNA primase/polymerase bifunctional N-terminal domain-containing protein n=1 Tax=Actinacidiphila oryziradicis TaxID=2571141 RepID=A0A4U0RW07_9ACTN|nr:bifunctional DNA primase/polymerase [Actinacidiphila oryziradicis]TJZ99000.1 hypothetical protein FCI23_47395 [Actinacidiphila oryziradicis]
MSSRARLPGRGGRRGDRSGKTSPCNVPSDRGRTLYSYNYFSLGSSDSHADLVGLGSQIPNATPESSHAWTSMVRRGFKLFPVHGKRPWVKHWKTDCSSDPEWITQQLARPGVTGYGVVLGSGVLVVDTDTPEAEQWASAVLPATFTVRTAKGYHRYYRVPFKAKNSSQHTKVRIHDGTDVKADGGYVVGPGSAQWDKETNSFTGITYEVAYDLTMVDLPEVYYDAVRAPEAQGHEDKNAQGCITPPVLLHAQRSNAGMSVFVEDDRVTPRTRALLRDTSNGRDFRLSRVLFSLMRAGLTDDECKAQVLQSPLGDKVRERGQGYLASKVTYVRGQVEEKPAVRFTAGMWRSKVATARMHNGLRRVADAIALIATRRNATKLTMSSYEVSELAALTQPTTYRNMRKLEELGWLHRNTKTNVQGTGKAFSYTLTVPASTDRSASVGVMDSGMDSWRHGVKGRWYAVYAALTASEGQVKDLATRTGKSLPTVRRQLAEMQEAGVTRKKGKVWSLTDDAEIKVQTLAVGTKAEGARERQKVRHEEIRAARVMELELLPQSSMKAELAASCGRPKADGTPCQRASRWGACPQHRDVAQEAPQDPVQEPDPGDRAGGAGARSGPARNRLRRGLSPPWAAETHGRAALGDPRARAAAMVPQLRAAETRLRETGDRANSLAAMVPQHVSCGDAGGTA